MPIGETPQCVQFVLQFAASKDASLCKTEFLQRPDQKLTAPTRPSIFRRKWRVT
jgi:hypothetical protein